MGKICEYGKQDNIRYNVRLRRRASYNDGGQPYYINSTVGGQLGAIGSMMGVMMYNVNAGENRMTWGFTTKEYPQGLFIFTDGIHIWSGSTPVILGIDRVDGLPDLPVCKCDEFSCSVECPNVPDGLCCIDHSFTNGLLQVLQS